MNIKNRFLNAVAAFGKTNNHNSTVDGNAFLKYGSRRMPSTWSTPQITDEDFYTGYGFAVINKRANRAVVLGKKFLHTEAEDRIVKKANEEGTQVVHPYIDLINDSIEFSKRDFWYDISTYLDLEGIYYLMAVRAVTKDGKVGNIKKFTLLNPYWIRQVINRDGELGGYVEHNPHLGQREIPKEMIIPISLLNPFDPNKTYSLADAARDSQFSMKQANDFARESVKNNLNSPGILSSAIELPDDQFDNFVERIRNHQKGEPLFGNGAGTITWTDMQADLDKAALDKINSINRDVLLAVSGLSKTGVGVEESGTGREVSRTQKDDFTENAVMPQVENIIDALNLDYKKHYEDKYKKNHYEITLSNPLETNKDAEQADVDIRDSQFLLFQSLRAKGYSMDIASKYAKGLIEITDLGEPTEEVEEPTEKEDDPVKKPEADKKKAKDRAKKDAKKPPANNTPEMFLRTKSQLASRDVVGLYDDIDINLDELGCIMLNTNTIPVTQYVEDYEDDVYAEGDHTGIVGEKEPHVTLLYGLLENGNTWRSKVDKVLEGWSIDTVSIEEVSYFDVGDSYAIVALVEKSEELIDGHERISLLPHINTFSEYIPHITLAYVKHDEQIRDKWVKSLNKQYKGSTVATKNINYGDLPKVEQSAELYEGYPVPIIQYLGENAKGVNPLSEEASKLYLTEETKAARMKTIELRENQLVGVIDENSYVELAEVTEEADTEVVLQELNKRYHDQLVAIKKKVVEQACVHTHNLGLFDQQDEIEAGTAALLSSVQAAENQMFEEYSEKVRQGDLAPGANLEAYANNLALPFNVWFTVMFPIFASYRIQQTAQDLGIQDDLPVVAVTEQMKSSIADFSRKEAQSHVQTIRDDMDKAVARITSQTSDPAQIQERLTQAFEEIQKRRAPLIAQNATNRIFALSQFEADTQFLTRAGLIGQAFKQLYSTTGDPCPVCSHLIATTAASPVPFRQAFVAQGETIEKDGVKIDFDYEEIIAGNVHPNCACYYKIIIKDQVESSIAELQKKLEGMDGRTKEAREIKYQLQSVS